MATRGVLYAVFVLPVIFSIVFGSVVMADVLQEPDRELNMWPAGGDFSHKSIQIIGLAEQYSTSSPVKILVDVDDTSFDCGDLYITIYSSSKKVVAQNGFLDQCFAENKAQLPISDKFSEIVNVPGQYELVAEIKDKAQNHVISTSKKFTVK
jgi:hypothetical protein